jgi:hypothetical protein
MNINTLFKIFPMFKIEVIEHIENIESLIKGRILFLKKECKLDPNYVKSFKEVFLDLV